MIIRIAFIFLALTLAGCGGGGSSSGGQAETLNLSGQFKLASDSLNPQFVGLSGVANISQNGSQINGTYTADPTPPGIVVCLGRTSTFTGIISGNSVTVNGSGPGGSFSGTLTGDENNMSGLFNSILNGVFCSGSNQTTVRLTRI